MIKLCFKEYDWKLNLKACKVFYEQTGHDLQTVFMDYIVACAKTDGYGALEKMAYFSRLYSREIASKALHSIIYQENKNIPLAEIEDATFRVSWMPVECEGEVMEPWPMVMLEVAMQINDYFMEGNTVKKLDT
jgi:hypothetical protein